MLRNNVLIRSYMQEQFLHQHNAGAGDTASQGNPERLLHKRFSVRPRTAGLWLRMVLADGEELEGIAANDLSLIEGVGLMLTPPDTRSNTQRIYVPRSAIESMEVVGLIGAAVRKRSAGPMLPVEQELFPGAVDSGDR